MTKSDLVEILNNFARDGVVFSKEADFQLSLGEAIKNKFSKAKANVYFEVLALDVPYSTAIKNKKSSVLKEYIDIFIEISGDWFAIELKYVMPQKACIYETLKGKFITFSQGAYDLGAYNFIKDIKRLEDLGTKYVFDDMKGTKIKKCFSIMLTNCKHYRFNDFSRSLWKNYSVYEGKKTIGPGSLEFTKGDPLSHPFSKTVYNAITLKNQYSLVWYDYELKDKSGNSYDDYKDTKNTSNPGFSFLIIEI